MAGHVLAHLLGVLSLRLTFSLRFEKCGVTPIVNVGFAAVNFDHPRRHLIEQEAVVADNDYCAREIGDLLLQPLNRTQIQVVGGLVQDQYVIGLPEDLGQGNALELPARKVINLGFERVGHAEAVNGGVNLPAVSQYFANSSLGQVGNLV